MSIMQCDICARPHGSQLPFHCTTCARSALYKSRIQLGNTLLDNSTFVRQINSIVATPDSKVAPEPLISGGRNWWALEEASAKAEESAERTKDISSHIRTLREEIENGKADIAKRKAALAQGRSDNSSATHELKARRSAALESVGTATKKMEYRWNSVHTRTVQDRVFLCREAANLYRLRQRRRKKGGTVKEDYTIGGVGIVDLRDLNNALPAQITTAFTSMAHLLVLASHYLLLRLPAEITLPHRDYPLPTIFPPSSSYLLRQVPFPGTSATNSSNNSPSASRAGDLRPLPHPRPLYLDKPLPHLAKDDPASYALFIEGVTLLAWDVAWLCRTQGQNIGANPWEDICAPGKNLWQLLVAPPHVSILSRLQSSRDTRREAASSNTRQASTSTTTPGHFSHGTAHSFLGGAEGVEYMRGWKLASPMKMVDQVKSYLASEMGVAEWEYLDEKEWKLGGEEAEANDDVVVVGGTRRRAEEGGINLFGHRIQADETAIGAEADREDGEGKGKGNSGWTKLKSR